MPLLTRITVYGNYRPYRGVTIRGGSSMRNGGSGGALQPVQMDDRARGVESEFYSHLLSGAPERIHYAPAGSEYTDRATGAKYVKTSGFGNTGWSQL